MAYIPSHDCASNHCSVFLRGPAKEHLLGQYQEYIEKIPANNKSLTLPSELSSKELQYDKKNTDFDPINEFLYYQLVFPIRDNDAFDSATFTTNGVLDKNFVAIGKKADEVNYSENMVGMLAYWNVVTNGGRHLKSDEMPKHDTQSINFDLISWYHNKRQLVYVKMHFEQPTNNVWTTSTNR